MTSRDSLTRTLALQRKTYFDGEKGTKQNTMAGISKFPPKKFMSFTRLMYNVEIKFGGHLEVVNVKKKHIQIHFMQTKPLHLRIQKGFKFFGQ